MTYVGCPTLEGESRIQDLWNLESLIQKLGKYMGGVPRAWGRSTNVMEGNLNKIQQSEDSGNLDALTRERAPNSIALLIPKSLLWIPLCIPCVIALSIYICFLCIPYGFLCNPHVVSVVSLGISYVFAIHFAALSLLLQYACTMPLLCLSYALAMLWLRFPNAISMLVHIDFRSWNHSPQIKNCPPPNGFVGWHVNVFVNNTTQ